MKNLKWMQVVLIFCAILSLGACDDDSEPAGKGDVEFEITDAPVDDANIKGVFVTVADIKVNGSSLQGFSKQTIDLKMYSEGNTKVLGSGEVDARTYENVVLVLDLENDASGNSPGCYVLDENNTKYQLENTASGTVAIALNKSWAVARNSKTNIVLDFDLRKAIRYSNDEAVPYSFVNEDNLSAAVNLVAKAKSGTIKGSCEENPDAGNADKIIVYAYKKGTFNASTETTPQGDDQILFANARSSAEVKSSLTGNHYTLSFLEEGDYELHFAAYTRNTSTEQYQFDGELESETGVDGAAGTAFVTVKGGVTLEVASTITGML